MGSVWMRSSMRGWRTVRRMRFSAIFRSACREGTGARCGPKFFTTGDTGLHRGRSRWLAFSRFHVLSQDGVHCGLVAAAVFTEKRQHVGIDAQSDLLLWSGPENGVLEEVRAEFGGVGKVYVFITHRINALPICLGWPFRILSVHGSSPF